MHKNYLNKGHFQNMTLNKIDEYLTTIHGKEIWFEAFTICPYVILHSNASKKLLLNQLENPKYMIIMIKYKSLLSYLYYP